MMCRALERLTRQDNARLSNPASVRSWPKGLAAETRSESVEIPRHEISSTRTDASGRGKIGERRRLLHRCLGNIGGMYHSIWERDVVAAIGVLPMQIFALFALWHSTWRRASELAPR